MDTWDKMREPKFPKTWDKMLFTNHYEVEPNPIQRSSTDAAAVQPQSKELNIPLP